MKITVAGVGYVGLSLAVLLAQNHEVTAITTTKAKAEKLNNPITRMALNSAVRIILPFCCLIISALRFCLCSIYTLLF